MTQTQIKTELIDDENTAKNMLYSVSILTEWTCLYVDRSGVQVTQSQLTLEDVLKTLLKFAESLIEIEKFNTYQCYYVVKKIVGKLLERTMIYFY